MARETGRRQRETGRRLRATKLTKITQKTNLVFFVIFVDLVIFVARLPSAVSAQAPPAAQQQKPPVFRAGAHYVRVDAYPTDKKGHIVEGLTKDDFEVLEDGKPQTIDNLEFVTFDTWTPEGERKDPRTQQDAYDLAQDPSWRVFVIVIDRAAYGMEGQHYMRGPLHQFLDRNLGPRDLFGLLTTENSWTDLMLGQTTTAADAVLDRRDWLMPEADMFDDRWALYYECGMDAMIGRKKLDDTYSLLEGLVKLLGLIRQEKKSIVFVSYDLPAPGPAKDGGRSGATTPGIPGVPSGPPGMPGGGPRIRPPSGGGGGPMGPMGHGDRILTPSREASCAAERMRLANIDFFERFTTLLKDARAANVAFYPVSPAGLQTIPFKERGGVDLGAYHAAQRRADSLYSLASETDGIAVVNTNDLAGGMRRIASDLQAYYVLGYYTTNTTWDGKVRTIKVRLKPRKSPSTSLRAGAVRARRQYRAPTAQEIAELTNPSASASKPGAAKKAPTDVDVALAALDREGRSADDRPLTLVLPPEAFRLRGRSGPEPAGLLHFTREERLRVEWQTRTPLDRRLARVLDRAGHPLPVEVPLREGEVPDTLVVELPMAAFARGDYVLELTAGSGTMTERSLLAFRVQ